MKDGNWLPLRKTLVEKLPKTRPYSTIEAMFSLQFDYDNGQQVTIKGYAKLWGWSRDRVRAFMQWAGVKIIYEKNTEKIKNQKGRLKKHTYPHKTHIPASEKKHIIFVDSKASGDFKNIPASEKKHKTHIPADTTKEPIYPNPKKNKNLPVWLNKELWNAFLEMRKKIKVPMTEYAEKLAIEKLKGFIDKGYSQEQVINPSIENNWKGLFQPKDPPANNPNETAQKKNSDKCGNCYEYNRQLGCIDRSIDAEICERFTFDASAPTRWVNFRNGCNREL